MKRTVAQDASLPGPAPRRSHRGCLLLIVVAVLLYLWVVGRTSPEPMQGTVSVKTGQITLRRADAGADEAVYTGQEATVQRGDGITTGGQGEAVLTVGGGEVFLGDNSEVLILQLEKRSLLRGLELALALEAGELDVDMASLGLGGSFVVETDIVTVMGTGFRCVADSRSVTVDVSERTVRVTQGKESATLVRGQRLTAVLGQPLVVEGAPEVEPTRTPRARSTRAPVIELDKTLFPVLGGDTPESITPERETAVPRDMYIVKAGDTLFSIAQAHDLDWEVLWSANKDTVASPEMLREGQVLRIPRR
jgi:hypothetical protein